MSSPLAHGLPHREPFIFIDEVVELQSGTSCVCWKTFTGEEAFFRGHFPGEPIVPGVLLAEGLAQTAGIAGGREGRSFRLSAIKAMKFLQAVRPRQLIELHARKTGGMSGLLQFEVHALVDGALVADGLVILSEVPPPAAA